MINYITRADHFIGRHFCGLFMMRTKFYLNFIAMFLAMMSLNSLPAQSNQSKTFKDIYETEQFRGDYELAHPYSVKWYSYRQAGTLMPEELPASQVAGSIWGEPQKGLQLAVSVENSTGSPVVGVLLVRNLRSETAGFAAIEPYYKQHYDFDLVLRRGTNVMIWSRPPPPDIPRINISAPEHLLNEHRIHAHCQTVTLVRLDKLFDLSQPGEYSVQTRLRKELAEQAGITNLVSGTATFRINGRGDTQRR